MLFQDLPNRYQNCAQKSSPNCFVSLIWQVKFEHIFTVNVSVVKRISHHFFLQQNKKKLHLYKKNQANFFLKIHTSLIDIDSMFCLKIMDFYMAPHHSLLITSCLHLITSLTSSWVNKCHHWFYLIIVWQFSTCLVINLLYS